ncbi:FGGY-family carbohydrate kinase [Lichenifustis flavocetrariae]|uniref:FGGY-family carbohydrate kinase n=1 Tax=Lichenifustis flavocetrariae TaxID=2949735 RepID=A0AA41YX25_9HYPH|nr:FGGY-family carbohydrate kinase [Lichenifustis flavocetrariae]MCW6508880.1 FGGY-family carbohydrate kinase [Lichenifustis flavocetrariae]
MPFVMGLDFGTGSVRVGLFDLETRAIVCEREAPYATAYPKLGWAEQSPLDWWEALGRAARAVMRSFGAVKVEGIAVATTASTVVACRRDGQPLRPALLWMDCRAAAEAERTALSRHPVMAYSGGSDAAEWLVPKAMWMAAHDPDFSEAEVVCECLDVINFWLTGRWVASRMNATCKWNYDSIARRLPGELYREFGVPGLEDKLPQTVIPVGEPVERLSRAAAAHLGLDHCPVLAQGGIDAHIGILGAGTVRPGELLMICGTSVVFLLHMETEKPVPGFWGPYPHALVDDLWLVEGGQVSAGSILSWLSRDMFGLTSEQLPALWDEAAKRPVGSTGLLLLDHFMGNRTPYRDPHLRGGILGLTVGHDRASLYRSATESVAVASAHIVERIKALGIPCKRIVSSGGFTKNPLWFKATVDAIGMPVALPEDSNLTIVGTAAAAATGAGLFPNLTAASDGVARIGRTVDPDLRHHSRYRELMKEYHDTTTLLAPTLRRLASHPELHKDVG